ncbi:MAG: hypothetical protein FWD60_08990 [Candidatus Azobacteroides sp.]|nr:hypothetical protein [Candidatus Azobacteroides sp.]
MKKTVTILIVLVFIASSCGNKKVPFDYSTLPSVWLPESWSDCSSVTVDCVERIRDYILSTDYDIRRDIISEGDNDIDNDNAIVIEGNKIIRKWLAYSLSNIRDEFEILESYQTGNMIVFNVIPKGLKKKYDFKVIWIDEDKGIAEWIFDKKMFDRGIYYGKIIKTN